ncbi:hypothetical protein [Ferrimonas kyonanensis]|uniref:hypothetical protein n=1 Tax=Ferrimonas kyonanensis TaxID=364763 RepID=UPI0004123A11|nr:hypothetical protein [Ferrimonas kyonanensis]
MRPTLSQRSTPALVVTIFTLLACTTAVPTRADELTLKAGGFIKAGMRYIDGTVPFTQGWTGSGAVSKPAQRMQFSAQESRFNLGLSREGVHGFAEIDFVGSSQGNSVISNSYSPRLRHAYFSYAGFTAGQTWSTLVNTSTFPETTNLGGPLVGEAMIRQGLIRYQSGAWQLALENPHTWGTQATTPDKEPQWISTDNDRVPDLIVRRDSHGDWGNLSLSALARYLDPDGLAEVALGASLAARLRLPGQDDLRLQLHYGNLGRYVGTGAATDISYGELETTTAAMVAYRHFWGDSLRSTVFYGRTRTEVARSDRAHWGINLFSNLTRELVVGVEAGQYRVMDSSNPWQHADQGDAGYGQLTAQWLF